MATSKSEADRDVQSRGRGRACRTSQQHAAAAASTQQKHDWRNRKQNNEADREGTAPAWDPAGQPTHPASMSATVLSAIHFLYAEEMRPHGKTLQWTVEHRAGMKLSIQELRDACQVTKGVTVMLGPCSDTGRIGKNSFTAALDRPPRGFESFANERLEVDISELVPERMKNVLMSLINEGNWPPCSQQAHERFELALWLRGRVAGIGAGWLSLGKATLVLQQATREKLLGRRDGKLVPFALSEDIEKQERASAFLPMGLDEGERYVATWSSLRACLAAILKKSGGSLAISKLKIIFRDRFAAELSETVFGHLSLTQLCADPEVTDYFSVRHDFTVDHELQLLPAGENLEEPNPDRFLTMCAETTARAEKLLSGFKRLADGAPERKADTAATATEISKNPETPISKKGVRSQKSEGHGARWADADIAQPIWKCMPLREIQNRNAAVSPKQDDASETPVRAKPKNSPKTGSKSDHWSWGQRAAALAKAQEVADQCAIDYGAAEIAKGGDAKKPMRANPKNSPKPGSKSDCWTGNQGAASLAKADSVKAKPMRKKLKNSPWKGASAEPESHHWASSPGDSYYDAPLDLPGKGEHDAQGLQLSEICLNRLATGSKSHDYDNVPKTSFSTATATNASHHGRRGRTSADADSQVTRGRESRKRVSNPWRSKAAERRVATPFKESSDPASELGSRLQDDYSEDSICSTLNVGVNTPVPNYKHASVQTPAQPKTSGMEHLKVAVAKQNKGFKELKTKHAVAVDVQHLKEASPLAAMCCVTRTFIDIPAAREATAAVSRARSLPPQATYQDYQGAVFAAPPVQSPPGLGRAANATDY